MRITHLSHSGFLIQDQKKKIFFDCLLPIQLSPINNPIYIFTSHSHGDHFNPAIMNPLYREKNAYFIFSKETQSKIPTSYIHHLFLLDHYENITIHDLKISTYGTTDLGNSYLVNLNGRNYFHSGDLNWWHWKSMTHEQRKKEEIDYKREIDLLKGQIIDFAFIPVDPRLEEHAYLALNYFIKTIKPKYVIPMHSFGQYDFYKDLQQHIDLQDSTLINVTQENEMIYMD